MGLKNLGLDKDSITGEKFGQHIKNVASGKLAREFAERYYNVSINY